MASTISRIATPETLPRMGDILSDAAKSPASGWQDIVAKVSKYANAPTPTTPTIQGTVHQFSGLLRLQMDVTQYQLRVEVVSKVAESAVASLRKLQQSQ